MKTKKGGYLIHKIRLLNSRLFNRYLMMDGRAAYHAEQGKILSTLWDCHPQTVSEIAQATGLTNSSLSAMIRYLEKKGLITSFISPNDKRKRLVDITDLGAAQQRIGDEISQSLSDVFYRGFSEEEIVQVEHYLTRILGNLEEESQKFARKGKKSYDETSLSLAAVVMDPLKLADESISVG